MSATNAICGQTIAQNRRPRRHATPELVLGKALRYLNRAISDTKLAPHTRIQAARAVLSTLHDAGVKPSQRDLAVVFRKLARDNAAEVSRHDTPVAVADTSAAPADEEKSKDGSSIPRRP